MPDTGVNAPAIRIMPADGHIIDADEGHQDTHRNDQPEGAITRHRESQSKHISFAYAPIAIEDSGGSRGVAVCRPFEFPNDHLFIDLHFLFLPLTELHFV